VSVSAETKPLPEMKNWFFAQGDWHKSSQLFVREVGKGEQTVIALHGGWGAEHSGMRDMIRGLEDHYRFVFYEQRGSLRSTAPQHEITFQQHIDDLDTLRKELGLNKLILLGHSMGAVLASAYAKQHPQNIEKLILVSPAYLKHPIPESDKAPSI
jgi:pimeloyl-ACP methyl ester carboxylesterase